MRKLQLRQWSVPLALFAACFLAYGLHLTRLGFYQDDWVAAWFGHAFPLRFFFDYFAQERPYLAIVQILASFVAGSSPLAWQIVGIFSRLAAALAMWGLLRALWPDKPRQATAAALLFAVYPSFKQQYLAVTYSLHLFLLACTLLSLTLMVLAARSQRGRLSLSVIAWLLSAFSLFSIEYYAGLELARPLILWLALDGQAAPPAKRLRVALLGWLPYALLLAAFFGWRSLIFQAATYEPKLIAQIAASPWTAFLQMAQTVIRDVVEVTVLAWVATLDFIQQIHPDLRSLISSWGLVFGCAALASFYLSLIREDSGKVDGSSLPVPRPWWQPAAMLGLVILLVAGLPFLIAGLPVGLEIPFDRLTLPFLAGASLLLTALFEAALRTPLQRLLVTGLLIGMAVGLQNQIAVSFADVHRQQGDFYQQMVWRMPGLRPGTLLLTDEFPIAYSGAHSLAAPLNWIYAQGYTYPQMDYQILYISQHLGDTLPSLAKGQLIEKPYRSITFKGSTSQAIVLFYKPPACLEVIDPEIGALMPTLPQTLAQASPLTNYDQVILSTDGPNDRLREIFTPGPQDGWCFWFEQADLARQVGDWQRAAALGDRALKGINNLPEERAVELVPYIEGYAHINDWSKARQISLMAYRANPAASRLLCALWARLDRQQADSPEKKAALDGVKGKLLCMP